MVDFKVDLINQRSMLANARVIAVKGHARCAALASFGLAGLTAGKCVQTAW